MYTCKNLQKFVQSCHNIVFKHQVKLVHTKDDLPENILYESQQSICRHVMD